MQPASTMRRMAAVVMLLAVAGCGSDPPRLPSDGGGHYKLGRPYTINGRTYRPEFDPTYDRTGIASWYGDYFQGRSTANGETFDKGLVSAAHTTLPLPSLVEVTNLENGRKLVVRLNDRGPFVGDRLIDLSEAAAIELGFHEQGLARVRVRFLELASAAGSPPRPAVRTAAATASTASARRSERAAALRVADISPRAGGEATAVNDLLPSDLADPVPNADRSGPALPAAAVACTPASHFVQVAAFSDATRADEASRSLRRHGDVRIEQIDGISTLLYRLRVGPLGSRTRAFDLVADLRRLGYDQAFVVSC